MLNKAKKSLAFWIIAFPMVIAALYYAAIAADRYVSESMISVRQSGDVATAAASGIATLLTGSNPQSREETLYLKEYIHSMDMLRHLDARFNLREAYGAEKLDPIYRLWGGTSQEWFHEYYRNRVEVLYDDINGLLTVRVEGFEPAFAHAVNVEILAQSERFVNEISHRLARDQLAFAESELRKAGERLRDAKAGLLSFQNKHGVFDPLAQAQAAATLSTQLTAEIAHKEAELKAMLGYIQESAPQAEALRNQIAALKAQTQLEQQKVASGNGGRLNKLAADYQNLVLEAGFAEEAYKAALAAVETTRIEASRKIKSVAVIESPVTPETAIYPRRIYNLITLLVALVLLYGIVSLTIATIKDHRD
jgi:capsular polysaccharide transport system permease protein